MIRNIPVSKNVAKVRSFLGMVNHTRKFAKHLASKTKPPIELLKKRTHGTEDNLKSKPSNKSKK